MTSHELARKLLELPDVMVTRSGYEGGVNEITRVNNPQTLTLNVNDSWYYGKHEYQNDYDNTPEMKTCAAIHIS